MAICIIEILRSDSDEEHRLTLSDIREKLSDRYGISADRKAVRRNIDNLTDAGINIESHSYSRNTHDASGKEITQDVNSDYYLVRDITDAELHLIIDSVLFSKNLDPAQSRELIKKLEGLSSSYFRSKVEFVRTLPEKFPGAGSKEVFLNIDVIDDAIRRGLKVKFHYCAYGTDKKLHRRVDEATGKPKEYIMNPYQIVAVNGRFYLICNRDGYDSVSNYRIDRIIDIHLTDEAVIPVKDLNGCKGFDLPSHMAEHIYMFAGASVNAVFRIEKRFAGDVIDWFGTDETFIPDDDDNYVRVRVRVNEQAMHKWALQYADHVQVLEPQSLVDQIKTTIDGMQKKYF
jgi:predicted DNA-binding transcriptional regulator YafY